LPLIHFSPFSQFLSGLQRYEKLLFLGSYSFYFIYFLTPGAVASDRVEAPDSA
jgi:hypothetical protein